MNSHAKNILEVNVNETRAYGGTTATTVHRAGGATWTSDVRRRGRQADGGGTTVGRKAEFVQSQMGLHGLGMLGPSLPCPVVHALENPGNTTNQLPPHKNRLGLAELAELAVLARDPHRREVIVHWKETS